MKFGFVNNYYWSFRHFTSHNKMLYSVITFVSMIAAAFATVYPTPPDVLFPTDHTQWIRKQGKSKLGLIDIPFVNSGTP